MGLTLILSVVGSVALALAIAEFQAWSPKFTNWIKKFAVRRLPCDLRERFDEEWEAHLAEMPASLVKLMTSCGFVVASYRLSIASAFRTYWRSMARSTCIRTAKGLVQGAEVVINAGKIIKGKHPDTSMRYKFGSYVSFFGLMHLWLPSIHMICLSLRYTECPNERESLYNKVSDLLNRLRGIQDGKVKTAQTGPWS